MEHAHVEIPQKQTTIIANTSEPIGTVITSPRIKRNSRHPGVVTLAAGNDLAVRERPYSHQVVLTPRDDILTVGGPAHADEPAVVAAEDIEDFFLEVVQHTQGAVLEHNG